MLISGFNAYLRVHWILRNGATLGGHKKGCKGLYIDDETAKQLANTGRDTHCELVACRGLQLLGRWLGQWPGPVLGIKTAHGGPV